MMTIRSATLEGCWAHDQYALVYGPSTVEVFPERTLNELQQFLGVEWLS